MLLTIALGVVLALGAPLQDNPRTHVNELAQLDTSQVEDLRGSDRWGTSVIHIPSCATEDDTGPCFWDAQTRGNKQGKDFLSLDGYTIYVELTGKDRVTVGDTTFVLEQSK